MTVKEIIIRALKFAGREDVAEKAERGEDFESEEEQALETMTYCFNAVEDELARYYFPLVHEENITATEGKFPFTLFAFKPVKILSVSAFGKEVNYDKTATHLIVDAPQIRVKYEYSPSKKSLSDECSFGDGIVSIKMLAAGSASEFSLINGEMKQAEFWESVYREEIDRVRKKQIVKIKLPPRRWA